MPRIVDPEQRADEILSAAVKVLADGGFRKLTLSNLARELGGSIRLVTHYFTNREELIKGIVDRLTRETDEILVELSSITDPRRRLESALRWFLLSDDVEIREESVRLALRDHQDDPAVAEFFAVVEPRIRAVLACAVATDGAPVADAEVDLLRIWTSGLALNAIERPHVWTPARQEESLQRFVDLLMPDRGHKTVTAG